METLNTVKLLESVYYGTTPQKKIEAKIIRKSVRDEIAKDEEIRKKFYKEFGIID